MEAWPNLYSSCLVNCRHIYTKLHTISAFLSHLLHLSVIILPLTRRKSQPGEPQTCMPSDMPQVNHKHICLPLNPLMLSCDNSSTEHLRKASRWATNTAVTLGPQLQHAQIHTFICLFFLLQDAASGKTLLEKNAFLCSSKSKGAAYKFFFF